jgi:hypothetical protein
VNTASSDYIQSYEGDRKTLITLLERIPRMAAEALEAVTDDGHGVEGWTLPAGSTQPLSSYESSSLLRRLMSDPSLRAIFLSSAWLSPSPR